MKDSTTSAKMICLAFHVIVEKYIAVINKVYDIKLEIIRIVCGKIFLHKLIGRREANHSHTSAKRLKKDGLSIVPNKYFVNRNVYKTKKFCVMQFLIFFTSFSDFLL